MKIDQLYYTFCKKGLSSGKGFQTYSMSDGLSEEERSEIEKHCFYIQPQKPASDPSKMGTEENFPIGFSFFKLKSGRPCVCRTKYKGIDSLGKFANYFCHVLVWEGTELPFYPIQLYNSKVFRDGLTEEENSAEEIKPLPILNGVEEEEFIKTYHIEKFLKESPEDKKEEKLTKLVDGIIEAKTNNKKVIFADETQNLYMWIAAATMVFPVSFANNITFNTYNFAPEGTEEFLCGTVNEGTKFKISSMEQSYKFNIFDLFRDVGTEFEFKSEFARKAALQYTFIKDYGKSFAEFMDLFSYGKLDERIDNYVDLLKLINEGIESLDYEAAIRALNFANEYGLQPVLERVMEALDEEALGAVLFSSDLDMLKVVFKLLFRAAEVTGKKDYEDKAYGFFFNAVQFLIVNSEEINVQDMLKLYDDIREYNKLYIQDFAVKAIENKRLQDAMTYLKDGNSRCAVFYMCTIFQNFIFLGKEQNSKIPWEIIMRIATLEEFVKVSLKILVKSKEALSLVFKVLIEADNYFGNLMDMSSSMCVAQSDYENAIAAYNEVLDDISKDKASNIIKEILDKKNGGEILIFAYKYKMKRISKRKSYFKNYCLSVFDENPGYRKRYFSLALEELMLSFSAEDFNMEFYKQFTEYIEKRKLEKHIGKFLATRLVNKFQDIVPIELPDEDQRIVIQEINFLNSYYNINVIPNISQMIHYAELLYTGSLSVEKFLCDENKFDFSGIDEGKYEKILRLMFGIICPKLDGTMTHIKMKNILMYDKFFIIYFNTYINTMNDIFNTNGRNAGSKTSYKLYFDFIYFIIKCKTLFTESQFKDIEKFIFQTLEKVDLSYLKNYDKYMQNIIVSASKSEEARKVKREWQRIYKNLNDSIKKKYILDKLQKLYRRRANE